MSNSNFLKISFLFFLLLTRSNCDSVIISNPTDPSIATAEIISPPRIRSKDYFPVVVFALKNNIEIDPRISNKFRFQSKNAVLENDLISLKKGAGCLLTKVQTSADFKITIEKFTGQKKIMVVDTIPVKSYAGTIDKPIEIWANQYDHHITGDLKIATGTELRIKQGARIFLDDRVNLTINGTLLVEGTKDKPVQFISKNWEAPWGGIAINNSTGSLKYCFFINGGADDNRIFGHSNSQPILKADDSEISLVHCYFFDNVGKALGANRARMNLHNCLISRCDTGGEFHYSVVQISNSYVLDIPNDDTIFIDDDNDGFYFADVYPDSDEPSRVENCYIITGKDDAIDHNKARLEINNCWLEDFIHEGIAGSNGNWVKVYNTVVKNCEQGIEAGYGNPDVFINHCVLVDNDIGLRFGDSYNWGCWGRMIVENTIVFNNKDNIYNFDLKTGAPVDSGIVISYSMTNDPEYDHYPFCITGVPEFDEDFYLIPNSPGKGKANDGTDMGRIRVSKQ